VDLLGREVVPREVEPPATVDVVVATPAEEVVAVSVADEVVVERCAEPALDLLERDREPGAR
jgi:hypothetical protein